MFYDTEISISEWENLSNFVKRKVSFKVNANAPLIGKRLVHIFQTHFLFRNAEDKVILEIHSCSEGIPFSSLFQSIIRLEFSEQGNVTTLRISNALKAGRFIFARAKIEQGAEKTNVEFYDNWLNFAHDKLEGIQSCGEVISRFTDKSEKQSQFEKPVNQKAIAMEGE